MRSCGVRGSAGSETTRLSKDTARLSETSSKSEAEVESERFSVDGNKEWRMGAENKVAGRLQ